MWRGKHQFQSGTGIIYAKLPAQCCKAECKRNLSQTDTRILIRNSHWDFWACGGGSGFANNISEAASLLKMEVEDSDGLQVGWNLKVKYTTCILSPYKITAPKEKVFRKRKLKLRNFFLNYFHAATSTHLYKEMKIPLMLITEPHSFSFVQGIKQTSHKPLQPLPVTYCYLHDKSIIC